MTDPSSDDMLAALMSVDAIYDSLTAECLDADERLTTTTKSNPRQLQGAWSTTSKRRKVGSLPYSTELQRRRKAELRALELEAQTLDSQLSCLRSGQQTVPSPHQETTKREDSEWRARLVTECELRVRAERVNKESKALLLQQFKLFESIRSLLRKNDMPEEQNFVVQPHPTTDRPLFSSLGEVIFEELASKLGRLYLQTDIALPALEDNFAVTIRSQSQYEESRGCCSETTVSTPLACTTEDAEKLLWGDITTTDTAKAFRFFSCDRRIETSGRIRFTTTLFVDDKNGGFVRIESASTMCKYKENNRTVMVGSTLWLLPAEGIQLEDNYWITVTPGQTDPGRTSVIRSKYRLHWKNSGSRDCRRPNGTPSYEIAMQSLGSRMHNHNQLQQNAFLDEVGSCMHS